MKDKSNILTNKKIKITSKSGISLEDESMGHEEQERQQNQKIIQKNIAKIIDNCINAVNASCFMKVEGVLNEVHKCLEQLNLTSINSGNSIASGIINISEGVDSVADKLSVETKQVLEEIELSKPEFLEKTITMLDEFINMYKLLGSNFDPAFVNPITFLLDENNLGEHRELVFTKISQLDPHADKQSNDWKKLNHLCKDEFDARFNELIKKKVVDANEAKCLINELLQIPFIRI
ncbi:4129_t:CDS:2 [Cetraspora pellucida]|uniref:4129_t:CDS:1 n=1 Tax=Cetraspora pellucida TaxID=1433469 RepID=A0ACA9M9Q1_9GLOM|nr:4129_t:CDS:2 [Cetraspora pellucida]